MELPFADVIEWNNLIYTIPAENANQTYEILSAISDSEVCRIRQALSKWISLLSWSGSSETVLMASVGEAWRKVKINLGGN
jgi:hypothetical protein